MRIGIVVYALDRPLTGISRYTLELIRAMVGLKDAPEVVLLAAGDIGLLADEGLPCVHLSGARLLPGLMTLGNAWMYWAAQRHHLDVIHDPTGVTPFFFGAGKAKKIVTVHDVIPWSYPNVSTKLDTLIYRHWLPRLLPRVDLVLTDSDASKQDILKYLHLKPDSVRTIYIGISSQYGVMDSNRIALAAYKYQLPKPYLLFVGSTAERKNLVGVIKAYAKVKNEIPHKLVVVGSKQRLFPPNVEALDALQLRDDVVFVDYVDEKDFPAVYSGADLMVFPSFYEGFGLPVAEAMASGTPVVTSNVSSLPEVGGDAVLQVNPYDIDEIVNAIRAAVVDRQLHEQLRTRGLERASLFSWERAACETVQAYQAVLGIAQ